MGRCRCEARTSLRNEEKLNIPKQRVTQLEEMLVEMFGEHLDSLRHNIWYGLADNIVATCKSLDL